MKKQISEILFNLGISPNLKGFRYLLWSIQYVYDKGILNISITKDLYPDCAKEFKTTLYGAERAMRHCIEKSADTSPILIEKFATTIPFNKAIPTVGCFIATIAHDLKLQENN